MAERGSAAKACGMASMQVRMHAEAVWDDSPKASYVCTVLQCMPVVMSDVSARLFNLDGLQVMS